MPFTEQQTVEKKYLEDQLYAAMRDFKSSLRKKGINISIDLYGYEFRIIKGQSTLHGEMECTLQTTE